MTSWGIRLLAVLLIISGSFIVGGLGGCANNGSGPNQLSARQGAPVNLIANNLATKSKQINSQQANSTLPQNSSVRTDIDVGDIQKAIERYRINKSISTGTEIYTGVDLNGDGVGEALVLFEGDDWCISIGCRLLIFKKTPQGFRVMSEIKRVKRPIWVTANVHNGWRELVVKTGNKAMGRRDAKLQFGRNYPKNASTVTTVLSDEPPIGEVVIDADYTRQVNINR